MLKVLRFLFLPLLLIAAACSSSDDGGGEENPDNFDRAAMLANWADNIIVPAYSNFAGVTQQLQEKTTQFTEDPTVANLQALREAYKSSYVQFQTVSMFEIGKAEALNYRMFLNTYPADASAIEEKIAANQYNLELPSSFDEQGFPGLDYLVNGLAESDAEIVDFYTGTNAEAYKSYLQAVSERINSLTSQVLADWQNSYRDQFVASTSSSSTGAVDRFTNDYIMYYEKLIRAGKIGIPAGAFTGDPVPTRVESYYLPELSKDLYLQALQSTQDFFNGKHFSGGGSGKSYAAYLDYLNYVKDGEDLSGLINSQFNIIKSQAEQLGQDFVNQIQTDNTRMQAAYDVLQVNVVLLKVDMMQALSISVDYVDTDGD